MIRYALFIALSLCMIGCDKAVSPTGKTTPGNNQSTSHQLANQDNKQAQYVGSEQCQTCHLSELKDWLQSDHHKAMMTMDSSHVLGNFSAPPLKHHQQQTSFSYRNNQYQIATDQNTSSAAILELAYTFGIFPLQQYLTTLPDGRIQSLPFAWDSRAEAAGGQRWFHLYNDEKIVPGDVLHWRSPSHNANHMCIECHTTDFAKNYDSKNNSYQSTWKEIGVGCESCHGAGSKHIEWARDSNKPQDSKKGWQIKMTSGSQDLWQHQTETAKAFRKQSGDLVQVERCAQCHSRRSRINTSNNEEFLMDAFLPSLLDETLYYPDGQIQDEVYEYGSFLQSKMANKGVTCSNCHNPHSGKIKIEGNGLCLQCHNASYDNPQHTMHKPDTKGSFCVDCHMPATTYMTIDARRDHSMRIPRPDLSVKLETPNACNKCHTDKSAQWATEKTEEHAGIDWKKSHYGEILAQARLATPSSYNALVELIHDKQQPVIVRATAISLLSNFPTRNFQPMLTDLLGDTEVLIRLGSLRTAEIIPPEQQDILIPLLQDQQRAIRIEAARLLAGNPAAKDNPDFIHARQEYIDSQNINADRAPALVNLASFAMHEKRLRDAEEYLLSAIKLEPYYIPASLNLADLYRGTNREDQAEKILLATLQIAPDNAEVNMSYALWLVRAKQMDNAIKYLKKAAASGNNPHFNYIYALALNQQGKALDALQELDRTAAMPAYNRDVHIARIEFATRINRNDLVKKYLDEWQKLDPDDPTLLQINSGY
ncbi:MAG TPA: multiheme c-type cytochrome [Pseudomonadales bacterium]|nr:multiheme c-type cytochrome [Pseudomonadales bacterium]